MTTSTRATSFHLQKPKLRRNQFGGALRADPGRGAVRFEVTLLICD
jgi:hypothetical protein